MSTRSTNEKKYKQWTDLPNGRLYYRKVSGQHNWYAMYFKEVDNVENTLKFWQEIYNEEGMLVEIHHKYPIDKGHQKINVND